MQDVPIRWSVFAMSRRIHQAQLAVSSTGQILLNVRLFDGVDALEIAKQEHGEVFVGIVLRPAETKRLVPRIERMLWNETGPLVGPRQRRRRRRS